MSVKPRGGTVCVTRANPARAPSTPCRGPRSLRVVMTPKPFLWSWSAAALLCALPQLGCDDDKSSAKPVASSAPSASTQAAATAPPPVTASASVAAAPPAPPKKRGPCTKEATITFTDANTETIVRRQLVKPTGPILRADLPRIKTLVLTDTKSDDVDMCLIAECTGAKSLYFGPGGLEDISPVKRLTQLMTLGIVSTAVKDLTPLQGLGNMDRLDISHTQVEDITVVGSFVKLTELTMDDTSVSDLSALAKTPLLEKLSIKNTRVSDLSPLKGLRSLQKLWISGSLVKDISPVSGMPKLKIIQDP
jgi:internalin A